MNEFVRGHFAGHFDFDLDKTLYFFTAGRPELTNKGVDYFLEGLAQLNYKMKLAGVKTTVIAFIIMPGPTTNYNVDSLKGQSLIKETRRTVDDILKNIGDRLIDATARGNLPDTANLLSSEDLVQLKRSVLSIKQRKIHPPIVTHNMAHEADPVLNYIRKVQLFNKPDDRVKIIYHPEFLTRTNPLIPLDYGEFVRGCHLGVFPSYYEPWGYTPAECTMMGVPSVSSNLTGFANYMAQRVQDPGNHGIFIVDRRYKGYEEAVGQLSSYLWRFVQLDRRQRIELRNRTERLSPLLDWKNLGQYYAEARRMATERVFGS
jgi:glycogen(starch) synthase